MPPSTRTKTITATESLDDAGMQKKSSELQAIGSFYHWALESRVRWHGHLLLAGQPGPKLEDMTNMDATFLINDLAASEMFLI